MINWKSILSSFNDKPTLLEWLKLVEKALKESVLTNVDTKTQDGKTSFIFKFEDGTEIATDYIETRGDTGATGPQGTQGVSVTGIEEVSDEVVGSQTLTTIRVHYSDGTSDELPIYAENGVTPDVTKDPFINGRKSGVEKLNLMGEKNKIIIVQCFDNNSDIQEFTINAVNKPLKGKFAFIIMGDTDSFAIVQTGSMLISDLVKTTVDITGVTASSGNTLSYFVIDGTLEAFKGDTPNVFIKNAIITTTTGTLNISYYSLNDSNNLREDLINRGITSDIQGYFKTDTPSFYPLIYFHIGDIDVSISYYTGEGLSHDTTQIISFSELDKANVKVVKLK